MGKLKVTEISTPTDTGSITIPSGVTFAPSGHIIQVVSTSDNTSFNTSSTSFTAVTNLSVDITPSSSSSKIFVTVSGQMYQQFAAKYSIATIYRDTTDLGASSSKGLTNIYSNPNDAGVPLAMAILDSPSTTSEITYQIYVRTTSGGTTYINENSPKTTITAMEIAG
ncbi:hypothetical protein Lederberg_71 [Pelagibacter phage Lederberg EXVC029P]|nr:hypothetical protein Lederberg_71 [Pelagibacter phage Lederberg EXVC029P]